MSFPDIDNDINKWAMDYTQENIGEISDRLWAKVSVSKVEKEEGFSISSILGLFIFWSCSSKK